MYGQEMTTVFLCVTGIQETQAQQGVRASTVWL